jgi:hypothetical protein
MEQEMIHPMRETEEKRYKAGISQGKDRDRKSMEKKTRWIHHQNAYNRKGRRICHPGIQENVLCDRGIAYVIRARNVGVAQYVSIKSVLERKRGPKDGCQ